MKLTRLALLILAAVALIAAPQATAPAKTSARATATKSTSAAFADINSAIVDGICRARLFING